jgi:putative tryptophan/tyrosine transport system substrate-binding protein
MRRREFITLLCGAAAISPLTARAQQPAMPVIGFVRSGTLADVPHFVSAFRQGLKSRWQLATRCRPVTASARASWPAA